MAVIRIADLLAAEERLDVALEALEEWRSQPANWSARESVSPEGTRSLHFSSGHFLRGESLRADAEAREQELRQLWRAAAGVGD